MAHIFTKLDEKLTNFIEDQKMFFISTAPKDGRINLSPKGLDCFKILSPTKVAYLNLTGSGNETSAHLTEDNRMTIMFCSFGRETNIIRLYGTAREIISEDQEFEEMQKLFNEYVDTRQIYILDIQSVQKSCGYGVPLMEYKGQRETLEKYLTGLGSEGVKNYRQKNNLTTIDGIRTRLPKVTV